MSIDVAPDGSPVEVFKLLPAGPGPALVHAAIKPGGSVVDLGCGTGRLARHLADRGHQVVGVDVCPAMLACSEPLETVCADIEGLDLGRTFDAVILASYLVNDPDRADTFLDACRRHLSPSPDGAVIVQRYEPQWAREGIADTVVSGPVTVSVHGFTSSTAGFTAVVTYTVGPRQWDQAISASILDDDSLGALLARAGLRVDRWLDEHRTWARLVRA